MAKTAVHVQQIKESKRIDLLRQKLSNPVQYLWPKLTDKVDHQIQLRLQRSFEPYKKCLRKVKKRPRWAVDHWNCDTPPLSQQEEEDKKNFKKLFCLGVSVVLRRLEKDELRLVLIWKDTQPPELKKAVLSLVAITGCPAASISDVLHPVKASYPALSCLTAIGILKSSSPNVFDDLVQYVKSEVPMIAIPDLPMIKKHIAESDTEPDKQQNKNDTLNIHALSKDSIESGAQAAVHFKSGHKTVKTQCEPEKPFDLFKYDINKDDFSGDFIKFSSQSHLIEVDEDLNTHFSYGIAAPLDFLSGGSVQVLQERKGKKRKLKHKDFTSSKVSSGYKEISIKHFNSNPNKRKKKKTKMK